MSRRKTNTDKQNKASGNTKKIKKCEIDTIKNEILPPPEHLSEYAKKKWRELAAYFLKRKLITDEDKTALEILCTNYGMSIELYNAMLLQSPDNTISGYFKGRNSQTMGEYNAYYKCVTVYTKMLLEFGMTPASRRRVPVQEVSEEIDEITKMLNGK